MGRAYTVTGIAANFGGTALPSSGNLSVPRYVEMGTTGGIIDYNGGTLLFEFLGQKIDLAVDEGTVRLGASGTSGAIEVVMGTAHQLRVKGYDDGGTLMELKGNGDLLIKGTIGQNKF